MAVDVAEGNGQPVGGPIRIAAIGPWCVIRGELSTTEASIAKLTTTELQGKVADECLQLFGGYGYTSEYPVEKFYRDAKIGKIYEGTSFMQLNTIAKSVLGD